MSKKQRCKSRKTKDVTCVIIAILENNPELKILQLPIA
jgi:hypothetical protein